MADYTFSVERYDPALDMESRYQDYQVPERPGLTVLEGLLYIQEELDGTLAFRYSCRGAVCGSCALRVNNRAVLSCRTQVASLRSRRVTIRPLPGFPVQKDLVVDAASFWQHYRAVRPGLHPREEAGNGRETRISPQEASRVETLSYCLLCMCCVGACPVSWRDPEYLGPAALSKNYRFLEDAREPARAAAARLLRVDSQRGVWGCDTVYRCAEVCPREIRPTDAVVVMRKRLLLKKLRRLLGKKPYQ